MLGRWLDWLPSIDASYIRTKAERSIQLVSQDKECCSSEVSEESGMESVEDQQFQNLYDKPSKRQAQEEYVKKFLEQPPNNNLEEKDFPKAFPKDLFIRYNTPIPSSAAVERLFSFGKDILCPKRCRMTDKNFEMLLFLRAKKS